MKNIIFILFLSGCSNFASFEGAISDPELFSQQEVDAVIDCSVQAGRLLPNSLSIDLDNKMEYAGLTLNENQILLRNKDLQDNPFSRSTLYKLLAHELHHVDSFQRGLGGDPYEETYSESQEDSIVVCVESTRRNSL